MLWLPVTYESTNTLFVRYRTNSVRIRYTVISTPSLLQQANQLFERYSYSLVNWKSSRISYLSAKLLGYYITLDKHEAINYSHNNVKKTNRPRCMGYKQVGREAAIMLGFDLTGNKWSGFIRQALEIAPEKKIAVHCWRGGMRSGAMAWALNLYGFDVHLVEGGYKKYRRWVLDQFEKSYQLCILGGMPSAHYMINLTVF